jgi:O-antigen/teichoic acid export membrane protein
VPDGSPPCLQVRAKVTAPGRPGETPEQRDDRNLIDLLQELRVGTLGVQVLFGFLLGLPFTLRFSRLEAWQRWLYLAIVLLSSISIVLLVAPVAYHRLLFRRHQLGSLLRAANAMAIAGLATVALAVTGVVLLVTSYVEPGVPTPILTIVVGVLFASLWFVLPLTRRRKTPSPSSRDGDQ